MTRICDIFQIVTKLGLGYYVQTNIDSQQVAIQDLGEVLEIHGVLFVPGIRVSKL